MEQHDYDRIILSGDWHFGCHANSKSWLYSSRDYFNKVFIPWLKENVRPGDLFIHLGDLYENRQSIEQHVNDIAVDIVAEISDIIPFWIIIGNHDIYKKSTNSINALKNIKYIPNVRIFEEPEMLKIGNKKCLFMPWVGENSEEDERKIIENSGGGNFLFCHTDFQGAKFNRYMEIKEGLEIDENFHFDRIFSGHIHMRQELYGDQLTFVGTPYQITRSDMDNKKGFYVLDVETSEDRFVANKFSPEFVSLHLNNYYDKPLEYLLELMENNFVDLYLMNNLMADTYIFDLLSYLDEKCRSLEPFFYEDSVDMNELESEIDESYDMGAGLDIVSLMRKQVDTLDFTNRVKKRVLSHLIDLYNDAKKNI